MTVTKNVWGGATWVFNVHTWDSTAAQPFSGIGQFDMTSAIVDDTGQMLAFPWRICARNLGGQLRFKLWAPSATPEPSWSDPANVRSVTIPAEYDVAGQAGWYAGHLLADGTATYNGLGRWQFH